MKAFYLFLFLLVNISHVYANIYFEQISKSGKKANVVLDRQRNYRVGSLINFYEKGVLVSQARITTLTPRKTKAAVELIRGKRLENTFASRPMSETTQSRNIATIQDNPSVFTKSYNLNNSAQSLLFFPEQSSFLISALGGYSNSKIDFDGGVSSTVTELTFAPLLLYSPVKDFAMGFIVPFINQKTKSNSSSESASGLADPNFIFSYQINDVKENSLFWVATFSFSPSLGKAKDTNVLRGSHRLALGTQWGARKGDFSWSAGPEFIYFTGAKHEGYETKSKFEIDLNAEFQYDVSTEWAFYFPLKFAYVGEEKDESGSSIKSYYSMGAGLGAKYALSEKLNFFADLRYTLIPSLKYVQVGPMTYEVKAKGSTLEFNLGANYHF